MDANVSVARSASSRRLSIPGSTITIVAVTVVAWAGALTLMSGMDDGPGTSLHAFPVFLSSWIVMLTAMMLPSELNYLGVFIRLLRAKESSLVVRLRTTSGFLFGYALAWLSYGLVAYAVDALIRALSFEAITWNRTGPYLAGSVLILAALYQISSLKHSCLKGCRSPLSFFAHYWRKGELGAAYMGLRHGLVCVGCCWALMGIMFAVGAMSLTWMALLTVLMFGEKVLPHGHKLTRPIAGLLCAMGIWIALSPGTAPLLKEPMLFHSICGAS